MLRARGVSRWMGGWCDLGGLTGTEFLLMTNTCSLKELWDQHGFCYRRSNTPAHSFTFSRLWTDKHRHWHPLGGCACLFGPISEAGSTFNLYCSQFRLKEYIPGSLRAKINQQHLWHNVYYHKNILWLYSETCNGRECSQSINIKIITFR